MNETKRWTDRYSPVLIFFIIVGLLASIWLVYQRNQVEQQQSQIENIVDYDAFMRAASFEKRPTAEAVEALKKAHVTAMAVYDQTLTKASDAGDIVIYYGASSNQLALEGVNVDPGYTYVGMAQGKAAYFDEIKQALIHRLGQEKVHVYQSNHGPVIALTQPHEQLMDMNLGISHLQAMAVSQMGFNVIARPTNYRDVTKADVDYVFDQLNGVPHVTGMVFVGKEVLGYPSALPTTLSQLQERHIPVIGIEAVNQLQYDQQLGFMDLAARSHYSTGRLYTVTKDELKKLSPAEVSQWFYISDLERNIRFNLFPIYSNGVGNKTALATSIDYIKMTTDKLAARGFTFGPASVYPVYGPATIPDYLVMVGAIALFVFFLRRFFVFSQGKQIGAFVVLAVLGGLIFYFTTGTKLSQLLALSSAICAPVSAICILMDCWTARANKKEPGAWTAAFEAVVYVIAGAAMAVIGGLYIASLLGSTKFFMEFDLFRGVKLIFVAPILLTIIAYFQRFPLWHGKTIRTWADCKSAIKEFLLLDIKMYYVAILIIIGIVGIIFVGRSGHTAGIPVPGVEVTLRRFLENVLYARPREKEFLIGHPLLLLAAFGALRRWPKAIHFILTVGGVIGISSMVETFCHIRTPVLMSLARGLDGLWIGILIGFVILILVRIIMYLNHRLYARGTRHE